PRHAKTGRLCRGVSARLIPVKHQRKGRGRSSAAPFVFSADGNAWQV
ncbi:MAG: hypothetical protein ACI9U6_003077, partial [Loktanella salsilacus]